MYKRSLVFYFIFSSFFLEAQSFNEQSPLIEDYQLPSEQYISSIDGKVYMNVNIWGEGGTAGNIKVYEGIDFASLLSETGSTSKSANLKKVRLIRQKPDDNGRMVYIIDLTPFLKYGDRSNFPKIKPNDTIVFTKTWSGFLIEDIQTMQTLLTALTFIIQLITIIN